MLKSPLHLTFIMCFFTTQKLKQNADFKCMRNGGMPVTVLLRRSLAKSKRA